MRFVKLSLIIIGAVSLLTACNTSQQNEVAQINPAPNQIEPRNFIPENNDYYARQNLDLQAIGSLLEKAGDAEELEYLINHDSRINNLDLNQDGYADYIGVSEFEGNDNGERGLSLFSRFGPELIQEIATVIFDRGNLNSSGARVLLTGNDQLYGDNYNYEANWVDRALPIITALFNNRSADYNSPYYYGNYPDDYQPYEVVETPVYRTRINQIYAEPVFVQTSNPTINEIQIRSPYYGRNLVGKNFPKPGKLSKEEKELIKNTPNGPPQNVPVRNGWIKNNPEKFENLPKGNPSDFNKANKGNNGKGKWREDAAMPRGNNKPPKIERFENQVFNQPRPNIVERPDMKPPKMDNPGRGNGNGKGNGGGNPNKGNGGKGNGGENGNGGGNGKGGGKKN